LFRRAPRTLGRWLYLRDCLVFFDDSVARVENINSLCSVGPDMFLVPDEFHTSLVHLLLCPLSSDLIDRMVRLFLTNFYDDSLCPIASPTSLHAYKIWRAYWRNALGPVTMLVFVRCLTLLSIGPAGPNRLGVTVSILIATRCSPNFLSEN
jgi:hypothetical protein